MTAPPGAPVRRAARWLTGLVLALSVMAVGTPHVRAAEETSAAGAGGRPNVVVIMTDDQDERSMRVMHSVRRQLVRRGTTFSNFYATFPLCCPSRATFLTGQYAHNHGVENDKVVSTAGFSEFDDRGTLPISLDRAGYRTAYIGKYLNGYGSGAAGSSPRYIPRGWDEWYAPVGHTATRQYGYTLNENGRLRDYGSRDGDYQTDVYARRATRFVRRGHSRPGPFFLTVATGAPHLEAGRGKKDPNPRPAPRHEGRFQGERLPTPPSFNERNVSDKPSFVRDQPRLDRAARRTLQRRHRDRLASLLAVDDAVGKIIGKLRTLDELENTLIMFTSDNGYLLGQHRLAKKRWLYEESAGVPLTMRGPGIPPDVTRRQLTGNIDLAPTILDVANAEPGRVMDGIPLLPLAQDPTAAAERDILLENTQSTAVRSGDFMYAEHPGGEKELYDLARDPFQLESHDGDPAYGAIEADLADRLRQLEDCAGEGCR